MRVLGQDHPQTKIMRGNPPVGWSRYPPVGQNAGDRRTAVEAEVGSSGPDDDLGLGLRHIGDPDIDAAPVTIDAILAAV